METQITDRLLLSTPNGRSYKNEKQGLYAGATMEEAGKWLPVAGVGWAILYEEDLYGN